MPPWTPRWLWHASCDRIDRRSRRPALPRARSRPWIVVFELLFIGALLAGAGIALAIASAIIEPATTRAAFGKN
jgi:hypothetical protein